MGRAYQRKKKRKFQGNQRFNGNDNGDGAFDRKMSMTMKRKFHCENRDGSCDGNSDGDYNYNFFMNMTVLQNIISEVGKCPLCLNPIILQADLKNKYGFFF